MENNCYVLKNSDWKFVFEDDSEHIFKLLNFQQVNRYSNGDIRIVITSATLDLDILNKLKNNKITAIETCRLINIYTSECVNYDNYYYNMKIKKITDLQKSDEINRTTFILENCKEKNRKH